MVNIFNFFFFKASCRYRKILQLFCLNFSNTLSFFNDLIYGFCIFFHIFIFFYWLNMIVRSPHQSNIFFIFILLFFSPDLHAYAFHETKNYSVHWLEIFIYITQLFVSTVYFLKLPQIHVKHIWFLSLVQSLNFLETFINEFLLLVDFLIHRASKLYCFFLWYFNLPQSHLTIF